MISFRPTAEENRLLQTARDFAREQIRPQARLAEELRQVPQPLLHQASDLGFFLLELPEWMDGLEFPLTTQVQVLEELAYGDLGILQGFPGTADASSFFRLLSENPQIKNSQCSASGCGFGFLDAVSWTSEWGQSLRLERVAHGYELNGHSQPIRLAHQVAGIIACFRDEDGEWLVLLLHQSETPWTVLAGDIRLGLLAAGCGRISFDAVWVPEHAVLARGEEAQLLVEQALSRIYIRQAAAEVGLAKAALDYTVEYTAQRQAFGQPIAQFQGVSFLVADMEMEQRAVHHLVWRAAAATDLGQENAFQYALEAILRSHRAVSFVTNHAVQLLGGHGFVQEYPVEKWMRDAQAQVMLYGCESQFLNQLGERTVSGQNYNRSTLTVK
ncbi:acyl-CoA dehydrogenase family protein [Alicyclobacillus tolerans]|uniref:Acyl-CoA dehydrogenase n=1 Tax=Alicyclobacillus tolerans TaxID=90970 RepID=A0A1M6QJY8_9BACL|nr:acyl-CoA dehydrogenase family protein [Alicyclobacillus montanus]SHK20475.1 hypothetical protein SAMN05443507_11026 [Alicyclobacillus montanus]